MALEFNKTINCKTYWKFNNSFLYNSEYTYEVKKVILEVKKQYAATPNDPNIINQIDNSLFQKTINSQ